MKTENLAKFKLSRGPLKEGWASSIAKLSLPSSIAIATVSWPLGLESLGIFRFSEKSYKNGILHSMNRPGKDEEREREKQAVYIT